jgi:hypothetical protein
MRFATLILLGLVFAAGLGFAAHLIARDTVALPVSSIEAGDRLAPVTETQAAPAARRPKAMQRRPRARTATTTTAPTTTVGTTTEAGDDHGRNRGRGRGGDDSSSGRGRGGSDD